MSEDTDPIQAKRQAALAKLRARRGESRQPIFASRQEQGKDRLSLITKAYKSLLADEEEDVGPALLPPIDDGGAAPPDLALPPDVPLLNSVDTTPSSASPAAADGELPRVAKVRKVVARRKQIGQEAIAKWRSLMQGRRERQLTPGAEPAKPVGLPQNERRQMFSDLLTVDFLEHTRLWISGSPDHLDLSSTPLEEVERVYEQALYRRKVLEQLEKMNEQEIDALTIYLRTVKAHGASHG
jgi:hypothetical protein